MVLCFNCSKIITYRPREQLKVFHKYIIYSFKVYAFVVHIVRSSIILPIPLEKCQRNLVFKEVTFYLYCAVATQP